MRLLRTVTLACVLLLALTACVRGEEGGGAAGPAAGGSEGGSETAAATGPIKIWYSNNEFEIEWAKAVVKAWNSDHPDEKVTAQEIPAGETSEEVIQASIAAGNTPCLIYNTSPAAVPQFEKQGGLVALDEFSDGASYVEERVGDKAQQYQSPDGSYYQLPWKANPVMIFYNKKLLQEAGIDAQNPPLATYDEFYETSKKIVDSGTAKAAIWPSPASQFFQPWFDYYPLFAAQTDGTQLVEEGESQFADEAGMAVADFWRRMYDENLSPKEEATGDAFAEEQSAMAIVGPWAIAAYEAVEWGAAPVPTQDGTPPEETYTFSDAKSVALYSSCENRGTAWEFLKFSTSEEQDGQLLELTGQMPMRDGLTETYAEYFEENPAYEQFADQNARTVEVPNVPNSIEMWQTFRDAYSASVIFGDEQIEPALTGAAEEINGLVSEG
jgi:multiple sugar transport system substrate-binding protein